MSLRLFLTEIKDRYSQDNFRKLQVAVASLQKSVAGGGSTTVVNNNTTERIPLDGTEPISGTIEPDVAGAYDIGSGTKPLGGLYSEEVYVGANSLYVDGNKAISVDTVTGRLTYSNDPDQDLEVKSRGTGTLYIDSEGDIVISSTGTVTINGDAVANYSFAVDKFDIPSQIVNGNEIVLAHTPQDESETVSMNGLIMTEGASYDYTRTNNVISFNTGVITPEGIIRVQYAY